MIEALITHIVKFVQLNSEERIILQSFLSHKELKKKDFLLKENQTCMANYFIVKGCLRMFYITDEGTEQMIQFGIDNWWLTDYMSLDNQRPSQFNIQAVENSEVILLEQKL
jgi:CRP/FNR family transcriptional regulator, anaerobic regulatory protein